MNNDINDYIPSLLNPRTFKKINENLSLTQNSVLSRKSLSLKRGNDTLTTKAHLNKVILKNKENFEKGNISNIIKHVTKARVLDDNNSMGFSLIEDIISENNNDKLSPDSFGFLELDKNKFFADDNGIRVNKNGSLKSVSSATEINDYQLDTQSEETIIYNLNEKAVYEVSFNVINCDNIDISTKNTNIKNINISRHNSDTNFAFLLSEDSDISSENNRDTMNNSKCSPQKRQGVAVSLEIKRPKLSMTELITDKSKVLNLNTNVIEKLSHVIVQPPNYKLVKRQISNANKLVNSNSSSLIEPIVRNGTAVSNNLRQNLIDSYFKSNVFKTPNLKNNKNFVGLKSNDVTNSVDKSKEIERDDTQDMSKNSGVTGLKCDIVGRSLKVHRNEASKSPRMSAQRSISPRQDIKASTSDALRILSPKFKKDSIGSYTPRRNFDSIQFSLPMKSKSNKTSIVARNIPHHKIVAGTHFAVDAFCYGDIPNVKHYFLTHFHSDHYSGLKKGFNKILFCTKITADLCISRLGVSSKCIHVVNVDETLRIEGVEVTAVDANHCPGAVMLIFTLPNGKTMLHTGDFRASPTMESYPVFWNRDVHTIYLDTTYCNPRYDFPTQDQSLEMALHLLRQKKLALEKAGKKFSSVLIICGTYTIGKEKFFLGMAKRVGCSVWACPEKDRVLQSVEGRSFSHAPPQSCQLHVVPMKDLTHEKLRSYLDTLQGVFTEVVAFKPSGWENGKNSSVEKDLVTIYGIPYSEHSSFSELIRFVKFLRPKQVVPTVDISGGIKSVQKYFPCPLVHKEDIQCQSKVTDFFKMEARQQVSAVT